MSSLENIDPLEENANEENATNLVVRYRRPIVQRHGYGAGA
jgi:hypothetical protein